MVVHRHGVRIFGDGILVDVLKSHHDGGLVMDTFTATAIPRCQFGRGYDAHEKNVTNSRGILNIQGSGVSSKTLQIPCNLWPEAADGNNRCSGVAHVPIRT